MAESVKERLIKKFEDEIHALDRELKVELPREILRARELGDLRENAEYHAAKERQRLVESRISMLQKRVSEIALLNIDRIPTDRAGFGSTLHVVESTGEKLVFQLVMPEDADAAKGLISTTSPIGRAFLNQGGRRHGQGDDAGRHTAVRNHQAADDPSRGHHQPMTRRPDPTPFPTAEPYSPQLRTALVLTGTGTAGAYHAGVLRALHEAGVKLDVVAGRGIGVVGALFAAIDGAQRLWEEKGFWRTPELRSLYRWHVVARLIVWAVALSVAVVAIPIAVMVAGLVVFPLDFLLRMVGGGGAAGLVGAYLEFAQQAFAPDALPTWLPRLVFLVLGECGGDCRRQRLAAPWQAGAWSGVVASRAAAAVGRGRDRSLLERPLGSAARRGAAQAAGPRRSGEAICGGAGRQSRASRDSASS